MTGPAQGAFLLYCSGVFGQRCLLKNMATITKGIIVCPVNDGEDSSGKLLKWTALTGKVVDCWEDCGELRVQVRWFKKFPYPSVVPATWLVAV